jgi:hypothetical protein
MSNDTPRSSVDAGSIEKLTASEFIAHTKARFADETDALAKMLAAARELATLARSTPKQQWALSTEAGKNDDDLLFKRAFGHDGFGGIYTNLAAVEALLGLPDNPMLHAHYAKIISDKFIAAGPTLSRESIDSIVKNATDWLQQTTSLDHPTKLDFLAALGQFKAALSYTDRYYATAQAYANAAKGATLAQNPDGPTPG